MTFCLLENNDKTYNYVKQYYKAILGNTSIIAVDAQIQKNEIEQYLIMHNLSPNDQKAIDEWIQNKSSSFRYYLNSLKMLALSIYFMNHYTSTISSDNLNPEIFYHAVNIWNERTPTLVGSVFV